MSSRLASITAAVLRAMPEDKCHLIDDLIRELRLEEQDQLNERMTRLLDLIGQEIEQRRDRGSSSISTATDEKDPPDYACKQRRGGFAE